MPCWVRCLTSAGLDHFCKGAGEGLKQASEGSSGRRVDKTMFPSFPFVTGKLATLMFSVSGGAFSDAVARAAKFFRWFTAVLFKGRRKLQFKVTALKVGFPLSSEVFAPPHPPGVWSELLYDPGCDQIYGLPWSSPPCDGPSPGRHWWKFRLYAWNRVSGLIRACVYKRSCYFYSIF